MKVFTALSLAAMAASTTAALPFDNSLTTLKRGLMKRALQGSDSDVTIDADYVAKLFEASFVGRCLEHYDLADYFLCEINNIPDELFDIAGEAAGTASAGGEVDVDPSEFAGSFGLSVAFNITVDYDVSDMTVDTCQNAFLDKPMLQCPFLIDADDLQAFIADIQLDYPFGDVEACQDLQNLIILAATDDEDFETELLAQCTEDSASVQQRRALQDEGDGSDNSFADSAAGLEEMFNETGVLTVFLEEYNAIADRCDEVAPNTVARPPSPASLTMPSLITVAAALLLSAFAQ
ncbi:Hypothetical Protein FCC1311_002542 [Hondaea fermentalgiana]|uniref:Uncharacterized protein n=1 Tax=Hondaea fermentalgiana TaxID=2315210 RepID=A0A2R5FZ58_9STRA|nr:Hypothetical Protein FCC1311_002542 [Hondaea fermentalgiana]|eukprot:GBG24036.1 Hypothetical Protein FCC1311_002542 [Hondaea fermentalgiana]